MQVYNDIEQGSEEWLRLRLGKFTGSNAQAIASNGKGLDTLVYEKVAEIVTGKLKPQYSNDDLDRGHEFEAMARNSYELETGTRVTEVGFIELDEFTGCSPDGLVGDDGLIEVKCKNDANFVRHMVDKVIDSEHNWQMQMNMWVSGRQWCDYIIFNENFPKTTIITRVMRNESDIAKIKAGVAVGIATVKSILEKIK